jgi:hypothetical protein
VHDRAASLVLYADVKNAWLNTQRTGARYRLALGDAQFRTAERSLAVRDSKFGHEHNFVSLPTRHHQ